MRFAETLSRIQGVTTVVSPVAASAARNQRTGATAIDDRRGEVYNDSVNGTTSAGRRFPMHWWRTWRFSSANDGTAAKSLASECRKVGSWTYEDPVRAACSIDIAERYAKAREYFAISGKPQRSWPRLACSVHH